MNTYKITFTVGTFYETTVTANNENEAREKLDAKLEADDYTEIAEVLTEIREVEKI